ncbi:MAG: O-antigen ligase family protein [Verrucomicrobiaceae bacterium]|nr:O-antigen ligase family protein [Verrucomicrobiaceae bacterium]
MTTSAAERRSLWAQKWLPWLVALFWVPFLTRAIHWSYEHGTVPLKPRDLTLLGIAVVSLFTLLSRPRFSIFSLLWLAIPMLKIMDAGFLMRFENKIEGDHSVFVMSLISTMLISLGLVFPLSAPNWRRVVVPVCIGTICIITASIIYEWLGFGNYTKIPGRMSGFPVDPNAGPITICLALGILFTVRPKFWHNMAIAAIAAPGVVMTLSRSGMAVFIVLIFAYAMMNLRHHFVSILLIGVLGLPLVASGLMMLAGAKSREGVVRNSNVADRIEAIFSLDFDRIKSAERGKDLADGWEAVGHSPAFGYGTGSGNVRWMPHNQFVAIWLDIGLLGVLVYAFTLLLVTVRCVMKRGEGMFCLIPLWLYVPCSQTLFETPMYLMTGAVAASVLYEHRFSFSLWGQRRVATNSWAATS